MHHHLQMRSRQATTTASSFSFLLKLLPLLQLISITNAIDPSLDLYCGPTWEQAAKRCRSPCPSGNDEECQGKGGVCQELTGCYAKLNGGADATDTSTTPDDATTTGVTPNMNTKQPTKKPTGPRPYFLGIDTILQDSYMDVSSKSYGHIFDIATTSTSPAIAIKSLEFYVNNAISPGENITYEVFTKEGSWHGYEGKFRSFRLVARGNMTIDSGGFHMIPIEKFKQIKMNGNGTRHSLYVTLSTQQMIYQLPSVPDQTQSITSINDVISTMEDAIPLLINEELTIYEGAAVMIHPFERATEPIFYRSPRGFLGRIWYERDACQPSRMDWGECEGTRAPSPGVEVAGAPSPSVAVDSPDEGSPESQNSTNVTVPVTTPATSFKPTVNTMKVYLVITLDNVPDHILAKNEQAEFEKVTFDFFDGRKLLEVNEVDVHSVKTWYQQIVLKEGGEKERRFMQQTNATAADIDETNTTVPEDAETTTAATIQTTATATTVASEEKTMTTNQLEITVTISVLYSALPLQITSDLLQNVLLDNRSEFIESLKSNSNLNFYTKDIRFIPSVIAVDSLTDPPTVSPTYSPTPLVTEEVIARFTLTTPMIGGLVVGLIWLFATIFSTCYLKQARERMGTQKEMRSLMGKNNNQERMGTNVYTTEEDVAVKRRGSGLRASFMGNMSKGLSKKNLLLVEDEDGDSLFSDSEQEETSESKEVASSVEESYDSEEESHASGSIT